MASAKSSNSKVRSMCFFSSSHSGTFFIRSFSSAALIRSAISGQRVTPENCFAMTNPVSFFGAPSQESRAFLLSSRVAKTTRDLSYGDGLHRFGSVILKTDDFPQILRRIENFHGASARQLRLA